MDQRHRWIGVLAAVVSTVDGTTAQIGDARRATAAAREREHKNRARRLVTFLELPARRREAARDVLRLGKAAVPELVRVLGDPRQDVVFRAIQLLRRIGPDAAAALPALDGLARSEDRVLARAARWGIVGIRPRDVVLVCDSQAGALFVYDRKGEQVQKIAGLPSIYDADLLANGNFLVSLCNQNRVAEVDPKGQVVWERKDSGRPVDVDRLVDGNTLISGGRAGKVWEVDATGEIVWEFATEWPNEADRLPSGNTLVSDARAGRVVEVDPRGRIVWEYKTPKGTIDVERLNNGNTLLVLGGDRGVIEVDETGRIVWEYDKGKAHSAWRLPGGNTLLSGPKGVLEIDPSGKSIWQRTGFGRAASAVGY